MGWGRRSILAAGVISGSLTTLLVAGCGQRGPLYLPRAPSSPSSSGDGTAPAAPIRVPPTWNPGSSYSDPSGIGSTQMQPPVVLPQPQAPAAVPPAPAPAATDEIPQPPAQDNPAPARSPDSTGPRQTPGLDTRVPGMPAPERVTRPVRPRDGNRPAGAGRTTRPAPAPAPAPATPVSDGAAPSATPAPRSTAPPALPAWPAPATAPVASPRAPTPPRPPTAPTPPTSPAS